MSISQNIVQLKASLPKEVMLVAVSKFHPAQALQEAYDAGQRVFGESRAQELVSKQSVLPKDIQWHFIGPLQSNKIKDIAPFIYMIQSVDSLKLLQEINKQASKNGRIIRVLLEIRVAAEDTKHGLTPTECKALLQNESITQLQNILICGVMGMGTNTDDSTQIAREFHLLHTLFDELKGTYFNGIDTFSELSMGMSHDYPVAIREGSTMIRVGTNIFGEREY